MKIIAAVLLLVIAVNCSFPSEKENDFILHHVITNPKEEQRDWWESATFYQIYPRSFKDDNNDGIGDLQGIIEKLPHLKDIGVTATWLSPIFKSPQVDQGYDISDYKDIDPIFGTMDDFDQLVKSAKKLGIKIILDYVPNHTSDKHHWFINSVNRVPGYEDFYIWHNGTVDKNGKRRPPNNWISIFKGPAWTWNEKRGQYYFHQFASAQPDLNYRNPNVVDNMTDVLSFWLDKGVDGFRMDAVPHIFEIADLRDEPLANNSNANPDDYEYLDHIYTKDLNETFEMIYHFREHLDNYTKSHGGDTRIMMTEAYTSFENTIRYFGTYDGRLGAHFSFNFDLITRIHNDTKQLEFSNIFHQWFTIPSFVHRNWVIGNHDQHRAATRLGVNNIDGYNMLLGVLDGIRVTYNGEEIGMENGPVKCEEGQDPSAIKNCSTFDQVSRDFERTPFQWDDSVNAGFNKGKKPWLPVSPKYIETNLRKQKNETNSHFTIYKNLQQIRKDYIKKYTHEGILYGPINDYTLQLGKYAKDEKGAFVYYYIVIFNTGNEVAKDKKIFILPDTNFIFECIAVSAGSKKKIGDKYTYNDSIDIEQIGRAHV